MAVYHDISAEPNRFGPDRHDWSRGREGMPERINAGSAVPLASLAVNVLSLALPIVILQVYDRILPNAALGTFTLLIIGLVVVLLFDGFFRTARAYITGWSAARLEHLIGCRAIDRMLAAAIGEFEKSPPGIHLDRLYAIDQLREFHAGQARLVMIDLPFVGVFLCLIWFIGGPLVVIPIGLLAVLGAMGLLLGRKLKQLIAERAKLDDRRYSFIIEVLSRIQTVKLLAMEPLLLRRYERLQESGALGAYETTRLSNLTQSLGSLFSNLVMISVAAVGATMVVEHELSIGGLAASTLPPCLILPCNSFDWLLAEARVLRSWSFTIRSCVSSIPSEGAGKSSLANPGSSSHQILTTPGVTRSGCE